MGLGLAALIGCSTTKSFHIEESPDGVSQWESKARIIDRQSKKSRSVSVDFVVSGKERLRMNVTGAFSIPVAAAVLDGDQLTYILPRQKRYYQGVASARALRPLLRLNMEPEQLFQILRDEPLLGKSWRCRREKTLMNCENSLERTRVKWLSAEKSRRKVLFSGPRYDVHLQLERVPTKVQDEAKVFSLNVPAGFHNDSI